MHYNARYACVTLVQIKIQAHLELIFEQKEGTLLAISR
jgi:hypothetical protein